MNLSQIIQDVLSTGKTDAEIEILPLIANAAVSVAANPSALNLVAQGNALLAGIVAKGPKIGQEVLQKLASDINTAVQSVVATASVPPKA